MPPASRKAAGSWVLPARRQPSQTGPARFRFLNQEKLVAQGGAVDPDADKLWSYNLHYFDDLNALQASERRAWHVQWVDSWIEHNEPGKGTGWEPYPTSLRIVNWIKWALAGNALTSVAQTSLAMQTRWLVGRLEYHLLGNHLFANAKALVFAGLFFDGEEANRWLQRGLAILEKQIPEQVQADGGQFELSPMYHALALEDMLDLANVAQAYGRDDLGARFRPAIPAMMHWLSVMSHPDGAISFFNDAAFGVAPDNADLFAYAQRLGFEPHDRPSSLTNLQLSGYVRIEAGGFTFLADVARIGPDYLPGHAHADTLSFELSLGGQRLFVNSGTSEYGTGVERLRQRGTAAHNTVIVENCDSSEVWSGFRVGRRAYPRLQAVRETEGGGVFVEAWHDGYAHRPGRPRVSRKIELNPDALRIADTVSPAMSAEARYHLHPSISVEPVSSGHVLLGLPSGEKLNFRCVDGVMQTEPSSWHPEFGLSLESRCLVIKMSGGRASIILDRD